MTSLPDPLVGAEVDLQDFAFMPLQVARLRDSDFAATVHPEAAWYGVLLWAASWHQIPAGSLPDNDTMLMRLAGLGRDVRTWKKHREEALYGFKLCSDGRLYHPTIAEEANSAWFGKIQQRHRTFCSAVRKHNERNPEKKLQSPSFEEWEALGKPERVTAVVTDLSRVTSENVACDIGSKRKGQGQGQGQGDSIREDLPSEDLSSGAADDPLPPEDFELELQGGEPSPADLPLTPQDILDTWNDFAPKHGLSTVRVLTKAREVQCKARIKDFPSRTDWARAFLCIANDPFMLGTNDRGWKADFDYLVQARAFPKLVERGDGKN